jgi:hypothetical protein
MVGDAFQCECKLGNRVNIVHFASLQECRDCRPCPATTVQFGEDAIFPRDGLGSDGTFDDFGFHLEAAVDQEALEDCATRHGVVHRFCQLRLARDARQRFSSEREQRGDNRCRDSLVCNFARFGALTANSSLERPELRHRFYRGGRDLGGAGHVQFIEAAMAVRPAPRQQWIIVAAVLACQLVVGGIAVHVQDTAISPEMPPNAVTGPAVLEAIGHHGWTAPGKRCVVAGIGREPGLFRDTGITGEGWQAGFIREDPVAFQYLTQDMVCEDIQIEASPAHPLGHQPQVKVHASQA